MRKRMTAAILLSLLLLTACGTLFAENIVLPDPEHLERVSITASELEITVSGKDTITQLLQALEQSVQKNTGQDSVQDVPSQGAGLMRIDFDFKQGGTSTLFLYRKAGRLLLEQPYQGIWSMRDSLEDLLRQQMWEQE